VNAQRFVVISLERVPEKPDKLIDPDLFKRSYG
jgi:hypothetical protein